MWNASLFLKAGNWAVRHHLPFIPLFFKFLIRVLFNSAIDPRMTFGKNIKFAYGGIAVVIHRRVKIGDNVMIGQCVTIGGKSRKYSVPIIGNDVIISAGSVVIGDIVIGNNVVIGANSTVLTNIPDNSIVVGNPGKVIRSNINSVYDFV